jgi:hypothetical protein
MIELFAYIVVAITAIVFPFVKRELFKNSPGNVKMGPIPILSLAGAISLFFFAMINYFFITNPLYGANIPIVWEGAAITTVLPIVIFVVSYYYHRTKNINIFRAFQEIPPE